MKRYLPAALCITLCLPAATAQRQAWWSFQPLRPSPPPKIAGAAHPVDAFVLQGLRTKGLRFAPTADRRTLIRRLSFDLLGLPPKPEEVAAFEKDTSPYAWAKLVDRMLASPHYGERWARRWLDIVRFGETDGGEHNFERFNAWPYRDYVINALNTDLPFDQFIKDQIAGDALHPGSREKLAATGMLTAGPWDQVSAVLTKDPVLRRQARMDELDDMVTTVSATFLGLTVNCARCHDHKFDPIPTKDYYRLTAVFSGAGFGERDIATADERRAYEAQAGPLQAQLNRVRRELSRTEEPLTAKLLLRKYLQYDREHDADPQRMPLNPIYNRNRFAPVTAKHWRMRITGQHQGRIQIKNLQILPAGLSVSSFSAHHDATTDTPVDITLSSSSPVTAREIVWSPDPDYGRMNGIPKLYQLQCSDDATSWKTLCTSADHMSSLEADLPRVTEDEITAALPPAERENRRTLLARQEELTAKIAAFPTPAKLYCVTTRTPEPAHVLERGNAGKPTEPVTPGFLSALSQPEPPQIPPDADDLQRRTALANWIASPRNPLTARVIVNRIWQAHFGNGIVNTPSDFGLMGDRPSHPQLLDWLADWFIQNRWSLKSLHRLLVTSRTYMQSDTTDPKARSMDAGNRLLWHMPLKRMDAETLRDSILHVTGSLNTQMGGPSYLLQQKGSRGSYIYKALSNDGPQVWRRGIYRFVVRGGDRIFLDSFDCPDPSVATPARPSSNTPVQALTLLNNAFVLKQAQLFAERLKTENPGSLPKQITRAHLLAFGRTASPKELQRAEKFIQHHSLTAFCRALLNTNEFVFVP
jgi:hypothetical protein